MLKDDLRQVIESQKKNLPAKGLIKREITLPKNPSQVIIVTGIRRCGKSTLLNQTMSKIEHAGYLNLEDPRTKKFKLEDFFLAEEIFKENNITKHFFFDEIQNVGEWERHIRNAHDRQKKIFITGSNANMLSRELGTKLTGRHKVIELFPFSYTEFIKYTRSKPNKETFSKYLERGGFPEFLKNKDMEYLQNLFKNIIARDILVRNGIKNDALIYSLANYLISNVGKIMSFNRLSKILDIKSVRSTIDYCHYLQESYLIELVPNYSYSIIKQIINPKKPYAIDTGLIKANTLSFSKDIGRVFENCIFLHLRRKYKEIFYFKEDYECDFIVKDRNKAVLAVQCCYKLDESNLEREIEGLKEAMKKTKAGDGIIVTLNQEETIEGIKAMPAWKWMYSGY